MFEAVCRLGLEGIVSKRSSAAYRSGPTRTWIKVKNPDAPAATRAQDGTLVAMNGSLLLSEYPAEVVRLSCEKCGRAGQYRKQTLIERYGADIRLPDLREEIANCERRGQMHDTCMARYVDLVPR